MSNSNSSNLGFLNGVTLPLMLNAQTSEEQKNTLQSNEVNSEFRELFLDKERRDDANGQFFTRSLEQYSDFTFLQKEPDLGFDELCSTKYDLVRDIEKKINVYQESYANAIIVGSSTNTDTPPNEVSVREEAVKVVTIETSVGITIGELNRVRASNRPIYNNNLLNEKMVTAMSAMDTKSNILGFFGSPADNLTGLLTDPNLSATAGTFDFYAQTDAKVFAKEFLSLLYDIIENSNTTERIDTVLVPTNFKRIMDTLYSSTGDAVTAASLIKEALVSEGVSLIHRYEMQWDVLERYGVLAPGTDKDMLLLYKRGANNPDRNGAIYGNVERYANSHYTLPWFYDGKTSTYGVKMRQDISSVKYHYPQSALKVPLPKLT